MAGPRADGMVSHTRTRTHSVLQRCHLSDRSRHPHAIRMSSEIQGLRICTNDATLFNRRYREKKRDRIIHTGNGGVGTSGDVAGFAPRHRIGKTAAGSNEPTGQLTRRCTAVAFTGGGRKGIDLLTGVVLYMIIDKTIVQSQSR